MIVLPWPDRKLHPNARIHWAQKAKATKAARLYAAIAARSEGFTAGNSLIITFRPPNKRRRDLDGCLSSIKAYLDGLADAAKVDDSVFQLTIRMGEPVKGGAVEVDNE